MTEQWAAIPGFPDYSASTEGRIRRDTGGRGVRAGRVLKPQPHPRGYLTVGLWTGGQRRTRTVHGLVALAFIGPRPTPSHEVNHDDRDKTNNRRSNLYYCTGGENKAHAAATGLHPPGVPHPGTKLTDEQVAEIVDMCGRGAPQRLVATTFGVSQSHVSDLVNGHRRIGAMAAVDLMRAGGLLS